MGLRASIRLLGCFSTYLRSSGPAYGDRRVAYAKSGDVGFVAGSWR